MNPTVQQQVFDSLAEFAPVHLADVREAALLRRTEVKYLLAEAALPSLLERLSEQYAVLEVAGQRLNRYRTLYFDSADFHMYRRHHAGAADRFKVRARSYVESGNAFLEVKRKTNRKEVIKQRIPTDGLQTTLDEEAASFVAAVSPYAARAVAPRLWNGYERITLVHHSRQERVTLDTNLRFEWDGVPVALPGLVVVEVKRGRLAQRSPFVELMRGRGVRPTGFSKYVYGASLLYPHLKQNRLKPKQRIVEKLLV